MDIILYLTELLQTRKTVGILGLGTLYKKKSPGKYDAEKHAFVPPSFTIAFTAAIKEQEELANYVSQKRNTSVDSANYYISVFVEQIHTQLAEKYEADLGAIGKLKLVNDEIVFVTDQKSSFGFEFYGLPTLTEINPEKENVLEDNTEEATIPKTVYTAQIEEIEEENKLEEENPGHEIIEDVKKNGMPFFIKFLIALIVITILGAITYFINPTLFNKYLKNFGAEQNQNIPAAPLDTLNTKTDSLLADSLSRNNARVNLATDTNTIDSSTVTIYEVIVSAENSKAKADVIIARLAKRGLNAKAAKMPGKLIKISAATFLDKDLAHKAKDSLRILLKNPEIYVQPIKPKSKSK